MNSEENVSEVNEQNAPQPKDKNIRRLSPKELRRKISRLQAKLDEALKLAAESEANAKELQQAKEKIAELENARLYDQAEAENYRKRALRERSELLRYNGENVLRDLLEVADNFDRAIKHADSADKESLLSGFAMIKDGLHKILGKYEVKAMPGEGEKFDPNIHEALTVCPAPGKEDGTILAVEQQGYYFKDHVLRPSKVVVVQNPKEEKQGE
ncbi:nucleotide exchange factor GrpE [bacterium]|nr:nucleotide exchange factor GrpE [bacterium]MBR6462159.1 nucleotide exchange factor GrpE [bacterium]